MDTATLVELIFQVSISALSLIGSLLVIITYLVFPQLRQFSYQIVFCLAISDFIQSFANLLSISMFSDPEIPDGLCYVQAVLKFYANVSSMLWVNLISWTLYATVILGQQNSVTRLKVYMAIGFGIPVLFLIPPAAMDLYGSAGVYCWIKNTTDDGIKTTLGLTILINFYFPLWVSAIFIIFTVTRVIRYVETSIMQCDLDFFKRLRLYPIVLIVCWTPATINRIVTYCIDEDIVWLTCLHIIFSRLEGLLHMLVYGMSGAVQVIIKEKILGRYFQPKEDAQTNMSGFSLTRTLESRRETVVEQEMAPQRDLSEKINSFFERKRLDSNLSDTE